MSERVIVVGGGIAGLTAGFRLRRAGYDIRVLEAADSVGGRMSTIERDGFSIDVGASILMQNYTAMRTVIADAGLAGHTAPASDLTGFRKNGTVHRFHNSSLAGMARTGLIPLRDKLRALPVAYDIVRAGKALDWSDPARAGRLDTETVREYADRRIRSRALLDDLIDPVCAAMALAVPDDISVVDLLIYFRSVFGTRFFTFDRGVQQLPDGLAAHLDVETGARVTGIEEDADEVTVTWSRAGSPDRTERAAGCVVALQTHDALAVLPQLDATRREILDAVRYSIGLGVHFGLSRPPAEPSALVCQTAGDDPDLHLAILDHNKGPGRAPAGQGLIATYWRHHWGEKHRDDTDEEMVEAALPGFTALFPGADTDITTVHVQRWQHALLFTPPGRYAALARFHDATPPESRIRFAGDWLGTTSTNSALATGERAAAALQTRLGQVVSPIGSLWLPESPS